MLGEATRIRLTGAAEGKSGGHAAGRRQGGLVQEFQGAAFRWEISERRGGCRSQVRR